MIAETGMCGDCTYGFGGGQTWECPQCHEVQADMIALEDAELATGEQPIWHMGHWRTETGWIDHWESVRLKIEACKERMKGGDKDDERNG